MKKFMFMFVSAIMMAFTFGVQSCSQNDEPVIIDPDDPVYPEPEVVQNSLLEVPFGRWSAWVGGVMTDVLIPAWNVGEPNGLAYGDGSVINYSDLSIYTKLIVTATAGTPRFLLNRDVNEGQWNAEESESHLIEYPKEEGAWSNKYFSVVQNEEGSSVYTVDLAQIVNDKGYAHLHAIKGANWADVTVTSMIVEYIVEKQLR